MSNELLQYGGGGGGYIASILILRRKEVRSCMATVDRIKLQHWIHFMLPVNVVDLLQVEDMAY